MELIKCSVSDKTIEKDLLVLIAIANASQSSPFQEPMMVFFVPIFN